MSEIEQLENRVSHLSPEDLARFSAWFRAFDAARTTGSDADAHEKLVSESLADYGSGDSRRDAPQAETLARVVRRVAAAR